MTRAAKQVAEKNCQPDGAPEGNDAVECSNNHIYQRQHEIFKQALAVCITLVQKHEGNREVSAPTVVLQ